VVRWTIVTTIGLAVGIGAAVVLGRPIEAVVGMMLVTPILTALVGAALGSSQSVSLGALLQKPGWWVVATSAGLGTGLAAGVVAVEQVGHLLTGHRPNLFEVTAAQRAVSLLAIGLIAGLLLGAFQYLVLRRQAPEVKNWILTTGLALGGAFALSSLAVDALLGGLRSPAGAISFVVTAGVLFGVATSRPLRREGTI
jgi:hypothetical protein